MNMNYKHKVFRSNPWSDLGSYWGYIPFPSTHSPSSSLSTPRLLQGNCLSY